MSCGIGRRGGSDARWLWLWCSLAAAALIQPLAWEFPYAVGGALKRKKEKKERNDMGEFPLWRSGLRIQMQCLGLL